MSGKSRVVARRTHIPIEPLPILQDVGREDLVPGDIRGNFKIVPAGRNAQLFNLEGLDKNARMYTLTVYPVFKNPLVLFTDADYAALATADGARLGAPHRVRIDYGVGGQGSQSVFIDLRRGFKVSLPLSSIKVTVFNMWTAAEEAAEDPATPNNLEITVGASLAPGTSSNNDGLTITQSRNSVADASDSAFGVPPHAKSYSVYGNLAAGIDVGNITLQQFGGNLTLQRRLSVGVYAAPWGDPLGPFVIPADMTALRAIINGIGGAQFNWRIVWHLGL